MVYEIDLHHTWNASFGDDDSNTVIVTGWSDRTNLRQLLDGKKKKYSLMLNAYTPLTCIRILQRSLPDNPQIERIVLLDMSPYNLTYDRKNSMEYIKRNLLNPNFPHKQVRAEVVKRLSSQIKSVILVKNTFDLLEVL